MTPFARDGLLEVYRHMEWADASVWRSVLAHPAAGSDDRLRGLLVHLHLVQRSFLSVWTERSIEWRQPGDFPDLAAVQAWARPVYTQSLEFVGALDADALARPVALPWASQVSRRLGREIQQPTLAETAFQVTSHSTYHRGQINARLKEIGGQPPLVDFIAWTWFGKPLPEWQEAV